MMGGRTSTVKMCSEIFVVEHRVTGLAVKLIACSELNSFQ